MKASQVLKDEHRGIEKMLGALEKEAGRIESGEKVNVTLMEQGVDFLRNFADACHHHKEEKELFPALERAGVAVEGGPIGVMLADHVEGRKLIKSMADALDAYKAGNTEAAATLAASARAYAELLRGHIWKEDNVLFKMADQTLPDSVQEELIASFERIETDHIGPGVHERYHQMLDALDTTP